MKTLMVWLPMLAICLRWLPVSGPGRLAFCLGLSGIWALLLTAALMWAALVTTGLILHWLPVGVMVSAAVLVLSLKPPEWAHHSPVRQPEAALSRGAYRKNKRPIS